MGAGQRPSTPPFRTQPNLMARPQPWPPASPGVHTLRSWHGRSFTASAGVIPVSPFAKTDAKHNDSHGTEGSDRRRRPGASRMANPAGHRPGWAGDKSRDALPSSPMSYKTSRDYEIAPEPSHMRPATVGSAGTHDIAVAVERAPAPHNLKMTLILLMTSHRSIYIRRRTKGDRNYDFGLKAGAAVRCTSLCLDNDHRKSVSGNSEGFVIPWTTIRHGKSHSVITH
jgi:hypothetical protein